MNAHRSLRQSVPSLLIVPLLSGMCFIARTCSAEPVASGPAPAAEPAASQAAAGANDYRIQPSDALQITVFQEADLTQKAKVTSGGAINYPLLGTIHVAGLTLAEAEKKLTELLGKDYLVNPRVTVTLESNSSRRVIVLGQVKSPGSHEVPGEESLTLLQVIAKSGGFTDVAASDRVTIARSEGGKERKIVVNVTSIMRGGDRSKDIELRPGDVVSVPETIF